MTKTPEQLLEDLTTKGGAIICTGQCSVHEINIERALGNMAVREDGIGFIRKGPEWVEMVREGLAVRAYDAAMRPRRGKQTTAIPAIIAEAKAAGCENANEVNGYLAAEVSKLRGSRSND